jgi:hypothetical protein
MTALQSFSELDCCSFDSTYRDHDGYREQVDHG